MDRNGGRFVDPVLRSHPTGPRPHQQPDKLSPVPEVKDIKNLGLQNYLIDADREVTCFFVIITTVLLSAMIVFLAAFVIVFGMNN